MDMEQTPFQLMMKNNIVPDQFRKCSFEIAHDVVRYMSQDEDCCPAPNKTASAMRSLVDRAFRENHGTMRQLVRTIAREGNIHLLMINSIANRLFSDGKVNWGRIVTYCTFCGYVSNYCCSLGIQNCNEEIADALGKFVVDRLGVWIIDNGGWVQWVGFKKLFIYQFNL